MFRSMPFSSILFSQLQISLKAHLLNQRVQNLILLLWQTLMQMSPVKKFLCLKNLLLLVQLLSQPIYLQKKLRFVKILVEKSSPTGAQTIFVSQPKHVKHFFAKWIILASILFCLLGVAIGYLAGGGYLSPSLVPDSPYIQQLKQSEIDAASKNYNKGYRDGRDDGYTAGKEFGYQEGYHKGYNDGAYDELALLLDDYLG